MAITGARRWPRTLLVVSLAGFCGAGGAVCQRAAAKVKKPRSENRLFAQLINYNDVRAVAVAPDALWLATSGGLVRRSASGEIQTFSAPQGMLPGALQAVLYRPDGQLFVGGQNGLVQFQYKKGTLSISRRFSYKGVRALLMHQGSLWVGSWEDGLWRLPLSGAGRPQEILDHRSSRLRAVTALAAVGEALYIGSGKDGLYLRSDERTRLVARKELPNKAVWALASVGELVWVGTLSGLAAARGGKLISRPELAQARGLPLRDIRALLPLPDGLLLGTFGGGAWQLTSDACSKLSGLASDARVFALAQSATGLLVATTNGVLEQRDNRFRRFLLPGPSSNHISALAPSSAGLWVGTFDAGISLYQHGSFKHFVREDGLIDDWINHLAVQKLPGGEVLWVATPKGVSSYDGQSWTRFAAGEKLAPGHVNSIFVDGPRVLFASSGGISIYQGGRFTTLTKEQGLPLRNVGAVAVDHRGRLWAGGLNGLARLDGGSWTLYQIASGHLPDDWITALAISPQGIWAGTYDAGLAYLQQRSASATIWREPEALPCGWINLQALTSVSGALFAGTMGGGLLQLRHDEPQVVRQLTTKQGLPSNDVTAVAPAGKGQLWVGTRAGVVLLELPAAEQG